VGSLVELWGFGASGPRDGAPSAQNVEALVAVAGHRNLRLDSESLSVLKDTELALDFSSVAKGYGVDVVANWLQEQGVRRYLVEVGGEMRVSGLSHRGDAWQVAIEKPDSAIRTAAAGIALTDGAIATSGDYRNFFELDGRRYSHLIDPRTGWPVAHDLVSVTVIHPSAMLADAWATALTVLGAEAARVVAQQQGLAVYFIQRDGESLRYSHTAEFSPFLVVKN
jgi:thiamine biosynthesis lipoprotein